MISSTTLTIINIGLGVVVLPLSAFLWRLHMAVNRLSYDNDQQKAQIIEFKKKNVSQDKEIKKQDDSITKLDKDQGIMNNDVKHIREGIDELKKMIKDLSNKSND